MISCIAASSNREYEADAWAKAIYDLRLHREAKLEGIGIVNEAAVYFAGRSHSGDHASGIFALHSGALTQIEGADGEIVASHLCHHRSSIFYEVLSFEGGELGVFEYSLNSRTKQSVASFKDVSSATSLACVDHFLLRTSAESFLMMDLLQSPEKGGQVSVLQEFRYGDAISSITVKFAADIFSRAELYGIATGNRSVLRLRLQADAMGHGHISTSEAFLNAGDGRDGPLATATVLDPLQVLWTRDQVLVTDGCALREVREGHVKTLLGSPSVCTSASEEHVEPVPWASQISRPTALAGSAENTATGTILMLTAAQVLSVTRTLAHSCNSLQSERTCVAKHDCGWAEATDADQRACLSCSALMIWALPGSACDLEVAPHAGTRYSLAGCGCSPPGPHPAPGPDHGHGDGGLPRHVGIWAFLVIVTLIAALAGLFLLYRAHRRAAAIREICNNYGDSIDTAEFHIFTDDESPEN